MSELSVFAQDVKNGLNSIPKYISSKYFYDEIGDEIFIKIMGMPEYYLTRSEYEIFDTQGRKIIDSFNFGNTPFDLFELGAGDGTKTFLLLRDLVEKGCIYKPIDISGNAIRILKTKMQEKLPKLRVEGIQGEYFSSLEKIKSDRPKAILFLGSNIGNLSHEQAHDFFGKLSDRMNPGDVILAGFDLKKDPSIIKPAYNDAQGYTKDFNLNLLNRINKELGGDFDTHSFTHRPEYDIETGLASSYLESTRKQTVRIEALEASFDFDKGELIHTEYSRKYDMASIKRIVEDRSLEVKETFTDSKGYFLDVVIKKV